MNKKEKHPGNKIIDYIGMGFTIFFFFFFIPGYWIIQDFNNRVKSPLFALIIILEIMFWTGLLIIAKIIKKNKPPLPRS